MKDNIFYYPSVGKHRFPHECYFTEQDARDAAIQLLKNEYGYDLYVLHEDDIKIHKIRLNG